MRALSRRVEREFNPTGKIPIGDAASWRGIDEKASTRSTELECPACNGTRFPVVKQPDRPERKIYPAPCKKFVGKGRVEATD